MFLLVSLSRAGCYFSHATGIAVLVRANGFHWTICTIFFMTDWLCPSSTAHFSIPFYITSHSHNYTFTITLMMQYFPLNHWYISTKLQHIITHTSICPYHFLAVYCAHNSLYMTALLLRKNPRALLYKRSSRIHSQFGNQAKGRNPCSFHKVISCCPPFSHPLCSLSHPD